jgi:ATP-dependent DNA helicase RecG
VLRAERPPAEVGSPSVTGSGLTRSRPVPCDPRYPTIPHVPRPSEDLSLRRRPARPRDLAPRQDDPIGPLTDLAGVGPARAAALGKLGVTCQRDLLFLIPTGLRDWGPATPVESLEPGPFARVRGQVISARMQRRCGRQSTFRATLEDEHGARIEAMWFNQPWVAEVVVRGATLELAGPVKAGESGPVMHGPRVGREGHELPPAGTLEPLYPGTDGVGPDTIAAWCRGLAPLHAGRMGEPLPDEVLARYDLPSLPRALEQAHGPRSRAAFEAARRRLALEPLLAVQARLQSRRSAGTGGRARPARVTDPLHAELLERFPFRFTRGQVELALELRRDLARRVPMRRLLQGDVGSGKTVLALYAAMAVVESNGQAALMAPTEVLAEQHYYGSRELLAQAGVEAALLTATTPRDERRWLLERLARGDLHVVFGTHALFSKDVHFHRLDLAVIDEQHRFGVSQRGALAGKGDDVHLLLMTATPIPRTLAMTVYGDLEVSTLREAPPGRGGIRTRWVQPKDVPKLSGFLAERLAAGEQAYWVCPRIGELEDGGEGKPAAAERRYAQACESALAGYGVELVHGRVPAEERAHRLDRFRRSEIGLLVATTVVEVGVDVANATVMVIENAERLGLAQLHQLRGRVGRGPKDSWCLLLGSRKASERFRLLERTRDGFEIAEADLAQRGMGDLAGVRQAGVNLEGLADPDRDVDLVLAARDVVRTFPEVARVYGRRGGGV